MSAQEPAVDEAKIRKAVQSGMPLTITTFTLPHEIEIYLEQVITVFLRLLDKSSLKDYVVYCVQELAVNAKKANTKRVYFMEHGLDLANPEEYKKGMARFKEDTLSNIAHYLELQKKQGLYIKLILQAKQNIMLIEVRNNVAVTRTELIRIHDKLARSRQFNSMEDALSQVLDSTEGAGLGLVILVLMLKKMGLDEDCFDIQTAGKETIARLVIPLDKTRLENISLLSAAIVENVNTLPKFPENIITLQKLLSDPNTEITEIARSISMDPALTGDLLRLVNSAQYMPVKRIDNIADAVKLVGIRGLKNLLYSYGTQKVLGEDSQEKKRLWEHSYKTAFYAYNLTKHFKKDRNLQDDVYVAGILHDMGKIIFSDVHPDLLQKIKKFCGEKNLPPSLFEDLSAGMNHAEIGASIAEKWNFPEAFINAIRFHHDPLAVSAEYRDLTDMVYLANMLCEYEDGSVSFDQFESAILEMFNITSPKILDGLLGRLSAGFRQENRK